ncbi:hypothetical protein ACFL21_03545, partial [Patescibacteria group bacterium]
KEGYRTIVKEAQIELWDTVDLELEFELIPFITETESIPEEEETPSYKLISDENSNIQKLVLEDDEREEAIVVFQNQIDDPRIINGENAILLIDNSNPDQAYKVDVRAKERSLITSNELLDLIDGKWSNNGEYLAFTRENSASLWLIGEDNKVQELEVEVGLDQITWTYTNNLLFVTRVAVTDEIRIGNYSNYITIGEEVSLEGITFGEYHPDENSYTRVMTFDSLSQLPSNLVPTSNGTVIYFRVGGQNYKVVVI